MERYIAVPLYSDAERTQYVRDFNIPIINRAAAEASAGMPYYYTAFNNSQRTTYYPGVFRGDAAVPASYRYNSTGSPQGMGYTGEPLNSEVRDTMINMMTAMNNSLFLIESSEQDSLPTKFSLLSIAASIVSGERLYFKNGAYITVFRESESGVYKTRLQFVGNGQTYKTEWRTSFDNLTLSHIFGTGQRNTLSGNTVKDFLENLPNNSSNNRQQMGSFGFNAFVYTFDDNGTINWTDIPTLSKISTYYGSRYIGPNSSAGPAWRGFTAVEIRYDINSFFRIFGLSGRNGKPEDIVNLLGGSIKENTEDSDNTYPGGGEDNNTYPMDGESGKGSFDNTNDPVDFPTLPIWDALSSGFVNLWNPNPVEILDFYQYMWSGNLPDILKKWFIDPMDAIISLSLVPVDPLENATRRTNLTIALVDTEIETTEVTRQFTEFDFGQINVDEYYGAAWDYSPYTKASIFLPYIGIQEVDVDDIMNSTIHLKYHVDLLTGMTVAMLKVMRERDNLDGVIYTWQGNCAMNIPVTGTNFKDVMCTLLQTAAMTGLAISQPVAGAIGSSSMFGESTTGLALDMYGMNRNKVNSFIQTYNAMNVLGSKVHVQRGSKIDGLAGALNEQCAYLILNRPYSGIPNGWNSYAGYPSLKIKRLGSQKGFTSVAFIKLNGLDATSAEIEELDALLKNGVIL